jgi:hypothetical protein
MMKILHQGHGHSHGGGGGGGDHGHSHGGGGGGDASSNLNVQAAFIHVLGDLLQSIGVMIAAAVSWAVPSAHVADPVCTFLFALLVLGTTVGIMRQGIATLLNAVPAHISVPALAAELAALPGVSGVHDLHVWAYGSEGRVALSAHLVVVSAHPAADALRGALAVARSHHIRHSTLQVEHPGSDTEACYEFNEHMDECALDLALEEGGGSGGDPEAVHHHDGDDHHHKGHGHAGGAAHGHSHAGGEHKHEGAAHGHGHAGGEHKHAGGAAHGHGHGHAGGEHKHAGGAAQGHSHAGGEHKHEGGAAHGHSHGEHKHEGGAAHGHSHGEHKHAGGAAHGHSHGEHKHEGAAHADA